MQQPQVRYSANLFPDWNIAQRHAQAANVGKQIEGTQLIRDYCECCHNSVQKEPISLGQHVRSLHFLGFGVPLFYLFLQCCLILNLLLIVTDSIYIVSKSAISSAAKCKDYIEINKTQMQRTHQSLSHTIVTGLLRKSIKNATFEDVDESLRIKCTSIFVYYAQTDDQFSQYEQVIRICSIAIHFCCLLFIKSKMIKKSQYYDERYHNISDYSVIIKELHQQIIEKKQKIKDLITELQTQTGKNYELRQIIIIPQSELLQKSITKRQQLLTQFLQMNEKKHPQLKNTYQELLEVQKNNLQLSQNCRELIEKDYVQSKNVIIIFQREFDKISFLQSEQIFRKLNAFHRVGGTSSTKIQPCPDPKEIIWSNLKYTANRKGKVVFVWFLSLCFLFFTYVLFYHVQTFKNQYIRETIQLRQQNSQRDNQLRLKMSIVGWSTWLGIILYNKVVMLKVLEYLTKFQKHDNVANQDFSFAFKYAIGMFFTSSIMKIVVQAVQNQNYYRHDFGIIQEESRMFFFSAVFLPLIWLIHPFRLVHLIKRSWYKGSLNITQAEANYLAAEYPYRVGKRYAQIVEMMWFSFLYVDLIPLGSFFIFFGQCFYYWIDKYNLIRRSSFNYMLSGSLTKKIMPLLDLTLVWRFLGAIIFDLQLRSHFNPVTFSMLIVSLGFVVMPWQKIFEYFDHQQYLLNDAPYSAVKETLFKNVNYVTVNPIINFVYRSLVLQRRTHFLGS